MASARPSTLVRHVPLLAVAALVTGACLLSSRPAHADYYVRVAEPPPPPPRYYRYGYGPQYRESPNALDLGFDLEGAIPVNIPQSNDGNSVKGGGGFKVRVGDRMWLGRGVRFTPELGYAYDHLFATDDVGNVAYSWDMNRVFGGARIAFGRFVVPVFYAHIGYGWRGTADPSVASVGGLAFDVGGALDLRVIPHFGIGAHVEYATIDAQPYTPEWVALGLHADIVF